MPYVVDTNIISEVTKHRLNDNVLAWFWDYNQDVFLTTVSVMELHYGIMRLPDGKRKAALRAQIDAIIKDCSDLSTTSIASALISAPTYAVGPIMLAEHPKSQTL